MTKTTKSGLIIFISICLFLVLRLVAALVVVADNYLDWGFSILGQVVVLGVIPLALYKRFVNPEAGSIKKDFKISPVHPTTYPLAVGLGVIFYLATIYINMIFRTIMLAVGYRYSASVGTIYSDNTVLIMQIICTALLPGIFEEIFNRGLLLKAMENVKSEKVKIIVSGIFFGLFHQYVAQFWYAIFGGIILTLIALRTKSIIPAMIMHFTHNFISVILDYSSQKMPIVADMFFGVVSLNGNLLFMPLALIALLYLLKVGISYASRLNSSSREPIPAAPTAQLQIKTKVAWWEYGFIYAAFVTTAITTVASFLWTFNG